MIGLIMAGGSGSRMNISSEKLLLKYQHPMIIHVINSLQNSNNFTKIIAATSSNSPKTTDLLKQLRIEIIETTGSNYVHDLNLILQSVQDRIFIVPGDLPLLDSQIIKKMVSLYNPNTIWTSYMVTKNFLTSLKLNSIYNKTIHNTIYFYTGISIVNSNSIVNLDHIEENYVILNDKRIAFNINTLQDYVLLTTSRYSTMNF